jgi:hypothetical protein
VTSFDRIGARERRHEAQVGAAVVKNSSNHRSNATLSAIQVTTPIFQYKFDRVSDASQPIGLYRSLNTLAYNLPIHPVVLVQFFGVMPFSRLPADLPETFRDRV